MNFINFSTNRVVRPFGAPVLGGAGGLVKPKPVCNCMPKKGVKKPACCTPINRNKYNYVF